MAIGTPVDIGSNVATGTGTTVVITTTADAPVGSLVLVNAGIATASNTTGISDSAGNTWNTGAAIAETSCRGRLFWSYITHDLPAGGTITVTWASSSAARMADAVKISGMVPVASDPVSQGAGNTATGTAPSQATGTLKQGAEIVIGTTYIAAGSGDTFTEAGAFTSLTANQSTCAIRWAYQIVSATGAVTYAPTLGTSRIYGVNVWSFKAAPLSAVDVPTQVRATVRRADHVQAASLRFLGQDRFPPGAAGQGPDYDWPNPARAVVRRQDHQQRSPLELIGASPRPFIPASLVNPRLAPWRLHEPGLIAYAAFQVTPRPFGQYDWPNPRMAARRDPQATAGYFNPAAPLAAPFAQRDWPNPRAIVRRQDFTAWRFTFPLAAAAPFAQFHWPNPTRTATRPEGPGIAAGPLFHTLAAGDDVGRGASFVVLASGITASAAGSYAGRGGAMAVNAAGLTASAASTFAGQGDDPFLARELAVGGGQGLAIGDGGDLLVSPGLVFVGLTAAAEVEGLPDDERGGG